MVLIMRKIFNIYLISGLLLLSSTIAVAQKARLRHADHQFELSSYSTAAKAYEQAFAKKATYHAAKGAARSYEYLASYTEANKWWEKTVSFDNATSEDYSEYISSVHRAGDLVQLKAALGRTPLPSDAGRIDLDSLNKWYAHTRPVELTGLELNSSSADYGIAFDQQGGTYFSSDRGNRSSSDYKSIRIDGSRKFNAKRYNMTGRDFIRIYKEGEKNLVAAIPSVVPKTYHFADPYFLQNQPVVFYTVTRDLGRVKKKRNYEINPEIYFSTINEEGEWVDFKTFPYNSALEHGVVTPFVDENEKRLYFSSDRAGGMGGYDLYYVSYDEDFNFGAPVNLGSSINTSGDERDPFLFDGIFYFASNGRIGLGGLDLFQAKYERGLFSGTKNLGLPYNSPQDDFALRRKGGMMYLSSNRDKGLDDIYQIEDLHRQFIGKVMDCKGDFIMEGLQVKLIQRDNLLPIATREEKKGVLLADLTPDADFQLSLNKTGYFSISDNQITTKGLLTDILEKEYVMKRIPYRAVVLEDLIYYNFDDSKIRADAEPLVKNIAEMMQRYTFLEILVKSHTDSWASDEYNERLSQKRANAVRDFLGDYGVARSRVKSEWFGEQHLVNDCGDGVPCPASAHQENRRSELILMAFPEEGKSYEYPQELRGLTPFELESLHLDDCQ